MEDIANVSIMRLDAFSMSKLWELMVMVFKWQLTVTKPNELFLLTERHLQGVMQLVPGQSVISKITIFYHRIYKMGKDMHETKMNLMRNALLNWLQDFNVRVSLLLRLGLQRNDGSFVITENPAGRMLDILEKIGDNIYFYEDCDVAQKKEEVVHTDTSEVSFLVNDILGDNKASMKNVSGSYLRFLQKDKPKLESRQQSTSAVCEFEVKPSDTIKTDLISLEHGGNNSTSTIHDDLLDLLGQNLE